MNKTLIIINGASCSGKSTLCRFIKFQHPKIVRLSFDQVKKWITAYKKEEDFDNALKILNAMANEVFALGMNAYVDGANWKEQRELMIKLAKKQGYRVLEFNLDVDYSVAGARFQDRVALGKKNPHIPIANLDPEKHKQYYDEYNKEKNPDAVSLDSARLSPKELYSEIEKHLK